MRFPNIFRLGSEEAVPPKLTCWIGRLASTATATAPVLLAFGCYFPRHRLTKNPRQYLRRRPSQ
jgi:hypothetical protein